MNRTAVTLAAALALAAVASPARADHDEGWRDRAAPLPRAYPAPAWAAPAPAPAPAWRVARVEGWRLRELRDAYRRLDLARDRFYATWRGDPGRRDRFEAWCGARRAELDARRAELARDHGRDGW